MPWVALGLDVVFLVIAIGLRTVVQLRRTGDTGWRLASAHSRAEVVARGCLVLGALLLAAAPIVDLARDQPLGFDVVAAIGIVGALAGIALVTIAQLQMGASWRIGVDPTERTRLVTHGVYRSVRNPIYTGIALFGLGQLLLVPNFCSVAAVVVIVFGIELQVRGVEEPYLQTVHGDAFARWAETAGRFVPTRRAPTRN
jgi:protein-S-isoprenylcysteine O-methyltransferase Ste14